MKYGAWSLPSGTAVIATGGRHAAELACGDAHESSPWGKPVLNAWSAATVASTPLLGTPGAMAVPPTVPRRPPWKVLTYGGLASMTSATLPGAMSLNRPKPARRMGVGANRPAIAAIGCKITRGV